MKNTIPEWQQREVAEYDLNITPPPRTILDIGANIGAFALHYAAKWPAATIFCFEPVKENYDALVNNIAGQAINIFCNQEAVRNFSGVEPIMIGDQGATCSFHDLGRQTARSESVKCVNASLLVPAELIKIDTEGCEVEILERLDLSNARALVIEYHRIEDARRIIEFLAARDFKIIEQIPGSANHGVLKFGADDGVTLTKRTVELPIADNAPQRKVFLACAAHFSNFDLTFVQSLLMLAIRPPVALEIAQPCTDPSVERARNILTANFLASDCTHILFVDADIGFTPADVARIASHNEPIVGGMYPLKTPSPTVQWCGNGLQGGEAQIREDGLSLVKYIGTGFLCIQREAFETMIARGVAEKYRQDWAPHREEFAFWTQGVRADGAGGPPRFLTEDWMFCQRWNELGGKIYCDSQVVLRHVGRAVWPLPLQEGNPFVPPPAHNPQPVTHH